MLMERRERGPRGESELRQSDSRDTDGDGQTGRQTTWQPSSCEAAVSRPPSRRIVSRKGRGVSRPSP